ncbi:unnamed protein product [Sphenostylis stenocarpa]|uniref:Uncharacterized protein n=1 Tax=Sphenostylis stenocarpa TaxID=92480 RepID=A0AA86SDW6_9FABA|nr:unnamed protein product [Sphenostylis stenocarpa]
MGGGKVEVDALTKRIASEKRGSRPGLWDITASAHIPPSHSSLLTATRELKKELGVNLPKEAFELIFVIQEEWYKEDTEARSLSLQKQLSRYAPISLNAELTGLPDSDKEALDLVVKAAAVIDEIFYLQEHGDESELNKLKWSYYLINKSPWSSLDEDNAFLTTADSAVRLVSTATKPVKRWKGLEYKAAFPDMDKTDKLEKDQQKEATSFFSVIRRHSELRFDSHVSDFHNKESYDHDLYIVPYSVEYKSLLTKAADLLHKAGDITQSPSLKRLLHSKADAFLSNDYYESDIAWMDLGSKLEVTIGPYETYEDKLLGYKASFEAFVGIRDDKAASQLKLFGDNLQLLEQNLSMDDAYKSKDVNAAPIRVIQLIYNAGDVKGPQIIAFNLPNDERIVKDRGTAMVMLKNVSEAKFKAEFPIFDKGLLSENLLKSMYVSFLAGCFRSVRFGLEEAHGKGQALQFNWLYEKGAFILHSQDTISVDFSKIESAVESLSKEILTIQAKGDKEAAGLLLQKYGVISEPLKLGLQKLEKVQVPIDIAPVKKILQ